MKNPFNESILIKPCTNETIMDIIYDFKSNKATGPNSIPIKIMKLAGADPAFVIRGGPNSEHFLSNLKKLLKRGKFFLNIQSLIVKRN